MRSHALTAIFSLCALLSAGCVPAPVPQNEQPAPQTYIAPGMHGLYDELNAAESAPAAAPAPLPPANNRPQIQRDRPPLPVRLPLIPYARYVSPPIQSDLEHFNIRQIVVKFAEGSSVRLRNGRLTVEEGVATADTSYRLERSNLQRSDVARQLNDLNKLLGSRAAAGRAAPQVDEQSLTLLRRNAEQRSHNEMPDPNLFYFIHIRKTAEKDARSILGSIQKLSFVEAAYFQPIPADATDIPPTTTIDVTPFQGYFMASPTGVDVNLARHLMGGHGEGVRIVDVEGAWDTAHEDLPAIQFGYGINFFPINGDHGTAVLGELAAQENGFGANGVAPLSAIGWSSFTNIDPLVPWNTYFYSVGNALLNTGRFLRPGDLTLIEQHFPNPAAGPCPNGCNCAQFGYVAVETMPYEHAAISLLTGAGIVVVEAAGNGQVMVMPASTRDSGAIVVGASDDALAPACFTNFGPRVDMHAWGSSIGSLGFGDTAALKANGADQRQWYTTGFGGTSGATPIVTGAAALIQSTRMAKGLRALNSVEMRTLLASTGTPQIPVVPAKNIGPLPNLATAIATYIPDSAQFVSQTGAPTALSPSATFAETVTFQNTGGLPWTSYNITVAPSDSGAFPWSTRAVVIGTAAAPIFPGDQTSGVFSITAPAAPGNYELQFVLKDTSGRALAFSPRQPIAITGQAGTTFDNASLAFVTVPTELATGTTTGVTVKATNTGSSTWNSIGYALKLTGSIRTGLPQPTAPVSGTVAPGENQVLGFQVKCTSKGVGGVLVQMAGQSAFGQEIGANINCN